MFKKTVLVLAIALYAFEAPAQQASIDSLTTILPTLPAGNAKIEVLNRLLKLHLDTDLEKARFYAFQVLSMSQKTGNGLALATVYKDMGVIHLINSAFDSSRYYNQRALQEYEKLLKQSGGEERAKIQEGYVGTLSNIGNWHYYQSALDSAIVYHRQAVDLGGKWGTEKPKANSLTTLAYIYLDQGQYEQAITMQLDALRIYENLHNQEGISRSYQAIGEINCEYLNNCERAIDYFRKALKIKKELGSERGEAYVYRQIGGAYEKLSAIDSAHYYYRKTVAIAERLKDKRLLVDGYSALAAVANAVGLPPEERLAINLKYIRLAEEIGRLDGLFVGYSDLGDLYAEKGAFKEAVRYYDKAAPLAESQKNHGFLAKLYFKKYTLYKDSLHDEANALSALEAYLIHHDSVSNAEKFEAVAAISTRYETEKKEATIVRQQEALRQGQIRVWLISAMLLIALAVGGLLFYLTRKLLKRNREKELLIKEIHHRVKNNLQVLSSLLHLQSRYIQDEAALDAVREGQNRVEAMSLIHQKLYMGDLLAAIEMRDYVQNLGETLLDAFGVEGGRVKIACRLDPLRLDVDTAIPLGLIINELVTNALKYAFPDGRHGLIEISLWKNDAGRLCLKVADNGVGHSGAPASKNSTSFGASLVELLCKKLKGKLEVSFENGYTTLIELEQFKLASL